MSLSKALARRTLRADVYIPRLPVLLAAPAGVREARISRVRKLIRRAHRIIKVLREVRRERAWSQRFLSQLDPIDYSIYETPSWKRKRELDQSLPIAFRKHGN
jgi:hypothetical protein